MCECANVCTCVCVCVCVRMCMVNVSPSVSLCVRMYLRVGMSGGAFECASVSVCVLVWV